MPDIKNRKSIISDIITVEALQPNRADLNGWFDSSHIANDSPDYKGFTVDATSQITGFEDGELAAAIVLKGSTLAYTINVEQNRIDFTGAGVLVGFEFGGVKYSCANGVCALGLNGREFYLENAAFGGYAVTDFTPIEEVGGVKIGNDWVVNDSLETKQVEVLHQGLT